MVCRLVMLRVAIGKQNRKSINIKQSLLTSNKAELYQTIQQLSNYQLHCFFYKVTHSNKHGIVHMNYQTASTFSSHLIKAPAQQQQLVRHH